jgi:hypothetical protein
MHAKEEVTAYHMKEQQKKNKQGIKNTIQNT